MPNATSSSRSDNLAGANAATIARLDGLSETCLQDASRADSRASVVAGLSSRNDASAALVATLCDRMDARAGFGADQIGRIDIRAPNEIALPSRLRSFTASGWAFYARNVSTNVATFLGFSTAGTLTDVALANGTYEIEVRPSRHFWQESRVRKVTTVVIDSGLIDTSGLPAIQDLSREIVLEQSVISWGISEEYSTDGVSFGLWFSAGTPVDTSGDPDATVAHLGTITSDYIYTRGQTANEYVAVAAYTDADQGPATELYMSWDTSGPDAPSQQYVQ